MDKNFIKSNIEQQIETINKSFYNIWGKLFDDRYISNNVDLLNDMLISVNKNCLLYKIISIICVLTLLVFAAITYLKLDFNFNKSGLIIFLSIVMFTQYFRFNKAKINLDHKIYLLNLLKLLD